MFNGSVKLPAGIYKLTYGEDGYSIEKDFDYPNDRFILRDTYYGMPMSWIRKVWNYFAISPEGTGAMLIGHPGSGKSDACKILGNIGINHGLPVLIVQSVIVKEDIIPFLGKFKDTIIILEEFTKLFNTRLQDQMLSLMSDKVNKKLFLLNDNEVYSYSDKILDRMGRIKFRKDFYKLREEVIITYIKDKGLENDNRIKDLMEIVKTNTIFQIDHLINIVEDLNSYKDESLKDILEDLNARGLTNELCYIIEKITDLSNPNLTITGTCRKPINKLEFDAGFHYYAVFKSIDTSKPETEQRPRHYHSVRLGNDNILLADDNYLKLKAEADGTNFEVILTVEK